MKIQHLDRPGLNLLLSMLAAIPLHAGVVPVNLPYPDAKPPAKDKPVKVFIQSGQSNSLGFGRVQGSEPYYAKVFLSADPAVTACKLPVDNAALLPCKVYQTAAKDAPLGALVHLDAGVERDASPAPVKMGALSGNLPASEKQIMLETFIEVPLDGTYHIHPVGDAVVTADGTEVYRKEPGKDTVFNAAKLQKDKRHEIRITYPKGGGSASLWLQKTDVKGMGDLRWVVNDLGRFPCMIDDKGEWTVRPDVILNDAYLGKGSSAPLSAKSVGPTFGPELGFGFVMGHFLDEPVIVIKADIGNRSLGWDILPPGSERYTYEGREYAGYGETFDADGTLRKPGPGEWYAGKQYDEYTASIRAVLDNFKKKYPEYAEQGFEVAGFVWWQGHKDGGSAEQTARYEMNLANLIKAWRKEFNAPHAKWAIATVGFHGKNMPENYVKIAEAQLAVADPKRHPEFAGTVRTIDARPFWREPEVSPKNQDYHYNHNAETYMLVGDALGRAMVEMLGGKVEYPAAKLDKEIPVLPALKPATSEQLAAMTEALRPIMLDKLIPDFTSKEDAVPFYMRRGLPLDVIAANEPKKDAKPSHTLTSQLDNVITYYQLAGIRDYDWKPFDPAMKTAQWHYLTFDPKEPAVKTAKGEIGDMYREVTLPAGSENWLAANFDPAKAGWKTGAAPFGQKNGKQEALIASCKVSYCGCSTPPATLWDKEVLLMRQTFDVPPFKDGHRYRIIVGGAGHAWSGEGFALYLNGKLITEAKDGNYKSGGDARGAFVFNDIMPEFKGGKATFEVKAFLRQTGHRGKSAPPSGHMSVWMEEVKLPPSVLALTQKAAE
jgi:alpha-galactosidase